MTTQAPPSSTDPIIATVKARFERNGFTVVETPPNHNNEHRVRVLHPRFGAYTSPTSVDPVRCWREVLSQFAPLLAPEVLRCAGCQCRIDEKGLRCNECGAELHAREPEGVALPGRPLLVAGLYVRAPLERGPWA